MSEAAALAKVEQPGAIARASELSVDDVVARVEKIQEVSRRVMVDGRHFGNIPGVKKPSLLKPGAEILCMTFQLAPKFKAKEKLKGDHLECVTTCTLIHIPTGAELGSAEGSCSTRESKYAYRQGERLCPSCGKTCIIKGREEYGGGWLCFAKKGGCGAKFRDGDKTIEGQQVGRVDNPDLPDCWNTVRKMAAKRALVAAVLIVTCASDLYTQDVDEGHHEEPQDTIAREQATPQHTTAKPANGTPKAVASDRDYLDFLALIREAESLEAMKEIRASASKLKFTREQVQQLNKADRQRVADLQNEGDPDPFNDAADELNDMGGSR